MLFDNDSQNWLMPETSNGTNPLDMWLRPKTAKEHLWNWPCFTPRIQRERPPPEPPPLNYTRGEAKKKKKKKNTVRSKIDIFEDCIKNFKGTYR